MTVLEVQRDAVELGRIRGRMTKLKFLQSPIPRSLNDSYILLSRILRLDPPTQDNR